MMTYTALAQCHKKHKNKSKKVLHQKEHKQPLSLHEVAKKVKITLQTVISQQHIESTAYYNYYNHFTAFVQHINITIINYSPQFLG